MSAMPRPRHTVPAASVVLAVLFLASCSHGLPWEDVAGAAEKDDLRLRLQSAHSSGALREVRGLTVPPCPVHPKPVAQQFISQSFVPDRLKQALKSVDAMMRSALQARGITAASLGVVYDQELIWQQGYGRIDPASSYSPPVDANTIFRVGSVTKLVTTLMLFKLRDAGMLSLDDPIHLYVPQLKWASPFKGNPGITWRSLAGQTSGLGGATPCNFFTLWEPILGDACDISNEEAWKRVSSTPPTVPMWEMPHYADSAYAILGRALESVVQTPYEDWVKEHIFKPLGMDSSFMAYDGWSDMAKRVPPGMEGNFTYPSFVAQVDLRWARPTGNMYSSTADLAKLASVFMVGQDEPQNALGIYSSSLREMMTPSFINDDRVSAYGYPFEMYHTSALGTGLPDYWLRGKAGTMPGYFSKVIIVPEIKMAVIAQGNSHVSTWDVLTTLIPAFDQTLWDLQPLPTNPGNLTAYEGTYVASALLDLLVANVTVVADTANHQLLVYISIGGMASPSKSVTVVNAVWQEGNSFLMLNTMGRGQSCLSLESGYTNILMTFHEQKPWLGGPSFVASLAIPSDPFYGWTFTKQ